MNNFIIIFQVYLLLVSPSVASSYNLIKPTSSAQKDWVCLKPIQKFFSDSERKNLLFLFENVDQADLQIFLREFPTEVGNAKLELTLIAWLYHKRLVHSMSGPLKDKMKKTLLSPQESTNKSERDEEIMTAGFDFNNTVISELGLIDQSHEMRELFKVPFVFYFDLLVDTSRVFVQKHPFPKNMAYQQEKIKWFARRQWEMMDLIPEGHVYDLQEYVRVEQSKFTVTIKNKVLKEKYEKIFDSIIIDFRNAKNLDQKSYIQWQLDKQSQLRKSYILTFLGLGSLAIYIYYVLSETLETWQTRYIDLYNIGP